MTEGRIQELQEAHIKLDAYDKKIMHLLSNDARLSYSQIAKKVRLGRDTVQYRVNRMEKNGIILGYMPRINLQYFGYQKFHVFMVVNSLHEEKKEQLIKALSAHPNTIRVMEYHATWDLEWVLVAKTVQAFETLINDVTFDFADIIVKKDELTTVKDYKAVYLPGTIFHDKKAKHCPATLNDPHQLDDLDYKILKALAKNGRYNTYELSRLCKTSADTAAYRLKRMQEAGIIKGFTLFANLSALNQHWYTFCINTRTFGKQSDSKFHEFIFHNPHILRAVKVLGDWDLLIYSVVDTPRAFHETFKAIHDNFIDVIANYETWNAYKEHAFNAVPPVLLKG